MSNEDKKILIKKFEEDMKTRSRFKRWLLILTQTLNVIWLNGSQDETTSSHIGRKMENGTATWLQIKLSGVLDWFEKNHCAKSIGE